jgi:5-methylcytosine-specific restriction endonuclease McrA
MPRSRTGWKDRQRVVQNWIEANGPVCPGYRRSAHLVSPDTLTFDHLKPIALGGQDADGYRVLCRSCNSRHGAILGNLLRRRTLHPDASHRHSRQW